MPPQISSASSQPRPKYFSTSLALAASASANEDRLRWSSRYDLWLLSSYFGLHQPSAQPLHAASPGQAYRELHTDDPLTPFQLHVPAGLRRLTARQVRASQLSSADPAMLPRSLWTERWRELLARCAAADGLDWAARLRLGSLLAVLGYDRLVCGVLPDLSVADAGRSDLAAAIAMRRSHAGKRAENTTQAREFDRAVLREVAGSSRVSGDMRLAAALTSLVLSAREDKDAAGVRQWRAVATDLRNHVAVGGWRELLLESTFWRAVSFLPFLDGDHETVSAELDLAEHAARALPSGTDTEDLIRRQNLHPLLETRTRAAISFGDLPAAQAYAAEAVDNDPYDGKVHITYGDVLQRSGQWDAAISAYQAAVSLGAPYAAKAQFLLGHCLAQAADEQAALDAFLRAVELDGAAYSAVRAAWLASGDPNKAELRRWASDWMAAAARAIARRADRLAGQLT
jgi:tetratricopeptide (TPR) repeat protein